MTLAPLNPRSRVLPLWLALAETNAARLRVLSRRDSCGLTAGEIDGTGRDWYQVHGDRITRAVRDFLPSGSGFDSGTRFDLDDNGKPDRLRFVTSFHHMNGAGYYDGWSDHSVTLRAALADFPEMVISGRDRNGVKDYIADTFREALALPVKLALDTDGEAWFTRADPPDLDTAAELLNPARAFQPSTDLAALRAALKLELK